MNVQTHRQVTCVHASVTMSTNTSGIHGYLLTGEVSLYEQELVCSLLYDSKILEHVLIGDTRLRPEQVID